MCKTLGFGLTEDQGFTFSSPTPVDGYNYQEASRPAPYQTPMTFKFTFRSHQHPRSELPVDGMTMRVTAVHEAKRGVDASIPQDQVVTVLEAAEARARAGNATAEGVEEKMDSSVDKATCGRTGAAAAAGAVGAAVEAAAAARAKWSAAAQAAECGVVSSLSLVQVNAAWVALQQAEEDAWAELGIADAVAEAAKEAARLKELEQHKSSPGGNESAGNDRREEYEWY